jgi:hypothetical protein
MAEAEAGAGRLCTSCRRMESSGEWRDGRGRRLAAAGGQGKNRGVAEGWLEFSGVNDCAADERRVEWVVRVEGASGTRWDERGAGR